MEKIIDGWRYRFIVCENGELFFIKAICLNSNRFSFVNNLNPILSEFNIGSDSKLLEKISWDLPVKKSKEFFLKSVKFLSDKNYRDYLENKLDEDRTCGEWENKIKS